MSEYRKTTPFANEIRECFGLGIQIQNESIATVFVNFYGHVGQLEVTVYYPYWYKNADPSERFSFYTTVDEDNTENEHCEDYVMPVINRLRYILSNGEEFKNEAKMLEKQEKDRKLKLYYELQQEFSSQPEAAY